MQKKRKRTTKHTTLNEIKPYPTGLQPRLWSTIAVFIGIGRFWKARRSHASKIDTWPHHFATAPRQLPQIHCNTGDPGSWFRSVASTSCEDLLEVSTFG